MASTITNSTLQVGMLSIPVALRAISNPKEVSFERASSAGNPIKRVDLDEVTGEAITPENPAVKGVWDGETFKPVPADSIDAIDEASKLDAFEITTFVPLASVPWERAKASYFLAPQKSKTGPETGAKAMALLHRALVKTKKAGVLKLNLRGSLQHLAVVYAHGDGLFVTLLVWSEDWAQADEANVLEGVKVDAKMVEQAANLVNALSTDDAQGAFDSLTDDRRGERAKLVEAALAGKPIKAAKKAAKKPEPEGLEALLTASLAAVGK